MYHLLELVTEFVLICNKIYDLAYLDSKEVAPKVGQSQV
jgi:hypothetical protein